jgi:assimilatory nitrate reductase catalytic subunit
VFGSNLAVASPYADHIARQLRRLELLVVCDAFENETSSAAHVVLPTTQWAEEAGTMTNLEGRVVLRTPVRDVPQGVRTDIEVMAALALRLGCGDKFAFGSSRAAFDELREVTAGARADYSGITYERLRGEQGVFWPCPSARHPGTPRLFTDDFPLPGGRARFHVVPYRAAGETPDAEYPLHFTTGRYREHYNSGAQTRRVAALVDAKPEPRVEMHPELAARLGVADGERVEVESRRGTVSFVVALSLDIRADTLFAPFHWGGRQAANVLTNPVLDPLSRMPEFKVCAVRAKAGHDTGRS